MHLIHYNYLLNITKQGLDYHYVPYGRRSWYSWFYLERELNSSQIGTVRKLYSTHDTTTESSVSTSDVQIFTNLMIWHFRRLTLQRRAFFTFYLRSHLVINPLTTTTNEETLLRDFHEILKHPLLNFLEISRKCVLGGAHMVMDVAVPNLQPHNKIYPVPRGLMKSISSSKITYLQYTYMNSYT